MEASSTFPSTTTMIYTFTLTTLAYLLILGIPVLSFCCSLLHSQGLNVLLQTSNKGLLMERPRLYAPLQTQCAMGRVHFQCKSVSPRVHSPENTLGHYTERTNRIQKRSCIVFNVFLLPVAKSHREMLYQWSQI